MDQLKQRHKFSRAINVLVATLVASFLHAPITNAKAEVPKVAAATQVDSAPNAGDVGADGIPSAGHLVDVTEQGKPVNGARQLDVLINGYKLDLVAAFIQAPDGSFSSARSELRELGIKVPGEGPDTEQIPLNKIPGLGFNYDETKQTIDLTIGDAGRAAKSIEIFPRAKMIEATSDLGVVLNYSGYAAANYSISDAITNFNGASVSLDARAFSKFGVVQQTGIVGTTTFSNFTSVRLDTAWSYSSQSRQETYRLGDVITGGLRWTRPVRMGGGEVQRNFSVRPDLITAPLPSLTGSAAVPSTLDVYINGAKTYSQQVSPGPFSIDNMPVITNQGTARVVLTDTTGRQTESETPFYSSPDLLSPGLFDYSLDVGVARRSFGTQSFDYDDQPLTEASVRYGINNRMTGEFHAEAKADMLEGGIGGVFVAGAFGTFDAAVAASAYKGDMGFYAFGAWDAQFGSLAFHASTARTFGNFVDLAAVTEIPDPLGVRKNGVPIAQDQFTIAYGIPHFDAGAGISLVHVLPKTGDETLLLGLNLTKSFKDKLSVYANAYVDLDKSGDYGAFIGFSIPLGVDMNSSAGGGVSKAGWAAAAEVSKPMDTSYGSYGWRVSDQEQINRITTAEASYRAAQGVASGRLVSANGKISGNAALDGSLVATKSGLFMGNPIVDSFAIVDAGVEGVDVNYENRFVGKTNSSGKLLVTQMRAYQPNKISINAEDLPLNSNVTETEKRVAPREKSGVLVDFGVKKDATSVIVILKNAKGDFIQPGTEVYLGDNKEPFLMGYDGQVYLTDIAASNKINVEVGGAPCTVAFDFKADKATQTVIGPLQCS